ncbi:DNA-binding protein [Salmonella enterica]|nr:DNA-binding protein [Salmonella enterica subsp. enterica]
MTAEQARNQLRQQGKTITDWARENGYSRMAVYRVLSGQAKANYGKAHEIAVKLGIKPNSIAA